MLKRALLMGDRDDVATVLGVVNAAELVSVETEQGASVIQLVAVEDIPQFHKIALRDVDVGDRVLKYGQIIGVATHEIRRGSWVHVQNLESEKTRKRQ